MTMILYTKTGCPWCNAARDFLKEKSVHFEERNVTENPDFMKEMVEKSGQSKAPTVDIDGHILADTDAEAIGAYLKEKGLL